MEETQNKTEAGMIYLYLLLYGILILALALLFGWSIDGLFGTLQENVFARRQPPAAKPGADRGIGWISSFGVILALAVILVFWTY
jgi:hypothetical protein